MCTPCQALFGAVPGAFALLLCRMFCIFAAVARTPHLAVLRVCLKGTASGGGGFCLGHTSLAPLLQIAVYSHALMFCTVFGVCWASSAKTHESDTEQPHLLHCQVRNLLANCMSTRA